ncbi:MAG: mechanosensitive ion channel family protein [Deltaproteobacteria bacterium]|nr:mechanosensitive ion channel family protein [Deltaproteobacteria bacterium]
MDTLSDAKDILWNTLTGWAEDFVAWAPRLAIGLVIGVLFVLVSKYVRRGATKLATKTRMSKSVASMVGRTAQFATITLGLMIVLSVLELEGAVTSLLAGAGVVGLALGFAFQDLVANVISGVGLSVKTLFRVGDVVETNDLIGVVQAIHLRTTELRTFDGKSVRVPNKAIYSEPLINHSDTDRRRIDVQCGVAYDTDLDHAKKVALDALEGVGCEQKEAEVFFESFGGSSIDFVARVWIDYESQIDAKRAADEMVRAIKRAFDAADIEIPFPIRTLELGESATEVLDEVREAA